MFKLTYRSDVAEELTTAPFVTLELLHQAVDNVNLSGDSPEAAPFSDGLRWIEQHTLEFIELLSAAKLSVQDFFRPHIGNPHLCYLLYNPQLLLSFTAVERLQLVRSVFLASGYPQHDWLYHALQSSISREDLVEMILAKFTQPESDMIYHGWKYGFLAYGAGEIQVDAQGKRWFAATKPTYWSLLSDGQLLHVLRSVAKTTPDFLFGVIDAATNLCLADRLDMRLGKAATDQLLQEVASELQQLSRYVHVEVFDRLPLAVQVHTARRLKEKGQALPAIWIAKMSLQTSDQAESLRLLHEFQPVRQVAIGDYLQWCHLLSSRMPRDSGIAGHIDRYLRDGLKTTDWHVACLEEEVRYGRKRLFVRVQGTTYLPNPECTTYRLNRRDYTLCGGDLVAFRPDEAGFLGASVTLCVANFTLLKLNPLVVDR